MGGVELKEAEAMALSQLVKRIIWSDVRSCAVDDREARIMVDAIGKLQSALGTAGYAQR